MKVPVLLESRSGALMSNAGDATRSLGSFQASACGVTVLALDD